MFSQVAPGQTAALQLLRGYPLPIEVEAEPEVPQPVETTGLSYRPGSCSNKKVPISHFR